VIPVERGWQGETRRDRRVRRRPASPVLRVQPRRRTAGWLANIWSAVQRICDPQWVHLRPPPALATLGMHFAKISPGTLITSLHRASRPRSPRIFYSRRVGLPLFLSCYLQRDCR
jgi:hypothetical protein